MNQNLDQLKKKSLLILELSPDTKTQVVSSNLNKFQSDLKRIASRKEIIVLVLEN